MVSELEPGVELVSGSGSGVLGMMEGVDLGFDCAMLVGYHAMAGTAMGVMEHTISGNVHRYWINGMPAGEIAMSAAAAGVLGVPLVMVSSDHLGCDEALALLPWVRVAVTKHGIGRYMGRLLHPSETGPLIERTAKEAVANLSGARAWSPENPVTVKIEFNRSEECDVACQLLEWARVDAYTVACAAPDWPTAHVASRRAMAAAGTGGANNG